MELWVGVQKKPEIAVYLTEDEWGMRDYIFVYEKNKQKFILYLTWQRTWRKFIWRE